MAPAVTLEGDHRHCKVCGRVCAPGQETDREECATTLAQRQQSRQNSVRLMYVLIVVVIVAFVLETVR